MTTEPEPERPIDVPLGTTTGSVGRALILAILTGIIDAGVFLKTGVLPSVMTANTIFIGLWLVLGHWNTLALAVAAVLTFGAASMVAARAVRGFVNDTRAVQRRLARLEFAALLILALMGVVELLGWHPWPDSITTLVVVVSATAAMALQMPQVRRVEDVGISTLFTTGAIAGLAYDLADRASGPRARRHERLYVSLIAGYAIGGAIGGGLALLAPGVGLLVPVLLFGVAWLWRLAWAGRAA
jgi:uncharacterized membrane protein YoaK (UPF0700 family)